MQVVVVIAGMEGALASVLGGLVEQTGNSCPNKCGLRASFGGVSALLPSYKLLYRGYRGQYRQWLRAGYSASMINQMK
jgi:hypothetical protein